MAHDKAPALKGGILVPGKESRVHISHTMHGYGNSRTLNPKPYLDPPMKYLFGSPNESPNPKTMQNPKKHYIGGSW